MQQIEHTGIINSIQKNKFRILILQETACNNCTAKGGCSLSGQPDKIFEAESQDTSLKVGDKVRLTCKNQSGLLAVFLVFVIPFFLILFTLLMLRSIVSNEEISGGTALFVLVPYYIILTLFNKKLKTKFKFEIIKENEI